jgi:short subunit fatty acids transporter
MLIRAKLAHDNKSFIIIIVVVVINNIFIFIFMKDKIENYKNFDRKTKKNNKKSRVEEPN